MTYQLVGDNIVDVHLGFLQHEHRYLIELHVPASLFKCQPNAAVNLVADSNFLANQHCRLADRISEIEKRPEQHDSNASNSTTTDEKYFVMKVEYFAHREHQLREELKLTNANNSIELLKLVVTARVLGKGKGTPMLRNGIHCIGYEGEPESVHLSHASTPSTSNNN